VSEQRIVMRVAEGQLEHALDHVLMLFPGGVRVDEETYELVAVGEPHELTDADEVARLLGDLLTEPPRSEPV